MNLQQFIDELQTIVENTDGSAYLHVKMADNMSVVKPDLKNGTIYITDIESDDSYPH